MVQAYAGETVVIDGRPSSGTTLTVNGRDTIYRNLEVTNSDPDRAHVRPTGIEVFGPRTKFVNLVVHDAGQGFGFWDSATDAEMYGCVIYDNGYLAADGSPHGHGIYVQNSLGTKVLKENLIFNQYNYGLHAYAESGSIDGLYLEGNVSFNNGSAAGSFKPSYLVGGSVPAERITFRHNYSYLPLGEANAFNLALYWSSKENKDVTVQDNYLVGGGRAANVKYWQNVTFTGNTLVGSDALVRLTLVATGSTSAYAWDQNLYFETGAGAPFAYNDQVTNSNFDIAGWRQATGFDQSSTYVVGRPTGVRVFVRPNRYEPGRAHIIVYNWDLRAAVDADVSGVLAAGDPYEVRNAQDYLGAPVLRGIYDGTPLRLPMAGLGAVAPLGSGLGLWTTGPEFNAFVLLRR